MKEGEIMHELHNRSKEYHYKTKLYHTREHTQTNLYNISAWIHWKI